MSNPRCAGCFFLLFGVATVTLYSITIQCMVDSNYALTNANHTASSSCRSPVTIYNPDPWTIAVYSAMDTAVAFVLFGLAYLALAQRRIVKVEN